MFALFCLFHGRLCHFNFPNHQSFKKDFINIFVRYIEFLALSKKDMKELDPFALEEAICEIGKLQNLNKGVVSIFSNGNFSESPQLNC